MIPPAPRNVRLVNCWGDEIPLELLYEGLDPADGSHRWRAVLVPDLPEEGWTLHAEVIPAQCQIVIGIKAGNS